jgi:CRP/FNR family transcriptional regulator
MLHPHTLKIACSNCNLRELCLPVGLTADEMHKLDTLVTTRGRVAKGEALFRGGDAFSALYAVRTGFFKTRVLTEDGRDHVTGFQMAGEILGLDGIVNEHHTCDAIALEDSEVCMLPYDRIEHLSHELSTLQKHMHRMMSREIVRDQGVMVLLGTMRAEERLATFLVNLLQRLQTRGFSSKEVLLRMTREEIGSYLGMKLETVSRTFSKFQADGLIEVKQRELRVLQSDKLQALVEASPAI